MAKATKDTVDFWKGKIAEWEKSGLSWKEFCEKKGLNRSTAIYWFKKFLKAEPLRKADTQSLSCVQRWMQISRSTPNTYRGSINALEHYQCPHCLPNQKWRSFSLKFLQG